MKLKAFTDFRAEDERYRGFVMANTYGAARDAAYEAATHFGSPVTITENNAASTPVVTVSVEWHDE